MTKLMKSSDSYKTYVAKEGKRFSDAVVKFVKGIVSVFCPGASLALTFSDIMYDYKKKAVQNKAERFLLAAEVDKVEFRNFINSLNEQERLFLTESIFDQLFASDEQEKISLYAFLFKDCVLNSTNFDLYARSVKAIKTSFIVDLAQLGKYDSEYWDSSEVGSRLLFVGLLTEVGHNLGSLDELAEPASTRYQLTKVGKHLLKVLRENHWDRLVKE